MDTACPYFRIEMMELYHLLNRGVEKREIVLDDSDRLRFIHDLFILNDSENVDPNHRLRDFYKPASERKCLVNIHAFCLMPNHYHLLVSEVEEGGISLFMRKLNMGYAKYFNEKYERSGVLWQGTFRKILIRRDAHFLYIPFYIHLNPLDFSAREWRMGRVKNVGRALEYLEEYRWSSFRDYMNIRSFPSLLNTSLLKDALGSPQRQTKIIKEIISNPDIARQSEGIE